MKRHVCLFTAICLLSLNIALVVYSHCHNTYTCEDVIASLVKFDLPRHWDKPNHNTIKYYVNPTHYGMPSLLVDVNIAAPLWTNLATHECGHISFSLEFEDETTLELHVQDNKNVVGWKCLRTSTKNPLATTRRWVNENTGEILEADIAFNYYRPLKAHGTGNPNDSKRCIRDVAAHEFGHFAGLVHVEYQTNVVSGEGNCPAWVDYTMHTSLGPNTHQREHLECEDKYALEHIYGKHN